MIRILKSPPFLRSVRWGTASIVNSEHFQAFIHLIATSPLPPQLTAALQPGAITNWGQFAESASLAMLLGIAQLVWAAITNPVSTLTIFWWAYESVTVVREALTWVRDQCQRWKRGEVEPSVEAPPSPPGPESTMADASTLLPLSRPKRRSRRPKVAVIKATENVDA